MPSPSVTTEPSEISAEVLRGLALPQYSDDADKADYGKLLIIAGSRRLPGAAILAARAALRCGCGTVRVAAPVSVCTQIAVAVPELMVIPLPETKAGTISLDASTLLAAQWKPCDAVVIGPGLDDDEETAKLLRKLAVEAPLPAVLDAAVLVALADSTVKYSSPRIFTPHLQELETLLGVKPDSVNVSREDIATTFARKENVTLVFKGRETIVAAADGKIWKNTAGTRGLGTAGSGDVLAGIIGGLLAQFAVQKIEDGAIRAAVWGVHLHALCGEAAEKDLGNDGMTASDLVSRLPQVIRYLRKQTTPKTGERFGLRPQS
jgi:hydroxyethylthiazole kinase-like uncharacterized protein yjeF